MSKLFFRDKPLIGLDIHQTGLKVMAIRPKLWQVTGYGSIDLDPQKMQDAFNNPADTYISDNVKTLLESNVIGSLPGTHTVISLPTTQTFSRTFTIPAKEEHTLASAVEIEADQYIPIPTSALYIDYEIIERTKTEITVVMSAVARTLVDISLKAARDAGLMPIMIEPSINSVARLLEKTEEGHLPTLIIDIGPASTDIAVLAGGAIRVTGGVGVGGNTLTLDIAKKMNISLEKAHQLKVLSGLNSGSHQAKISSAVTPSLQKITLETRKVVRYYNERLTGEGKIEQIIIVGGGSNMPSIGEFFTNELVMAARVASPWQTLDFGDLQKPHKQFRPRYINVAGLASIMPGDIWK